MAIAKNQMLHSEHSNVDAGRWAFIIVGALLSIVGVALLAGGIELMVLGGSWYYSICGAGITLSGVLLCRRDVRFIWAFALVYGGTIGWALWEAGFAFWPQVPRLGLFLILGPILALVWGRLDARRRRVSLGLALAQGVIAAAGIGGMFLPHGAIYSQEKELASARTAVDRVQETSSEWRYYGGDSGATHFAPLDQINGDNIQRLEVAWTFRTGEINDMPDLQATPLQIGASLYFCTAHNKIFALDADSGREEWTFDPKVKADGTWNRCRGVGYFDPADETPPGSRTTTPVTGNECAARIIVTTVDARLLALNARTGKLCEDFGEHGAVDLKEGLGKVEPGWYYPTSAPLVARGRVIVGGWVSDNQSIDEPGGVVRAFDAHTGRLAWAWDSGSKARVSEPSKDAVYARSTPNFWGTATFDDELGLVYIPTGNGTPDHWGGKRSEETDRYSTSVIALNIETGELVWHFQTVHHDLWDWDLSAPPTFVDMPDGKGDTVPALVQVGKAGQIFVLDRRTGTPVTQVVERPVPQGAMPGDWLSPTQPYSIGMPQVIPATLSEKTMWGASLFDQLACRIWFRRMSFKGQYTPPSLQQTPITPGYLGGMNWGGVAIDRHRNILVVNDIRLATLMRLVPREQVAANLQADFSHAGYELHPQEGTPYGVELASFMTSLGLPCEQPPWGMITAIDLNTRKIAWQIPAGTLSDSMGDLIGIQAPMPIGMPTLSAALMTSTGLTFYSGTNDAYLRAWQTTTGKELWKSRLPVGSQATPMTYISPKTNRQYIVVVAGGAPYSKSKGDYVIAFALPPPSG